MKFVQKISFLFILVILALFCSMSVIPLAAQEYKLIKGAKIYTQGKKGILEKGMILIKGTKIEKIGQIIDFPSDSQILDLSGKIIIPGIICASSSLYLQENDLAFPGEESPDTDILEGINHYDNSIPEILKHGVTTVYISPASFQFIGGLGAVVKLKPKINNSLEVLKEKAALKLRMERMQDKRTSNLLRLSQYHRVRDLFIQAQEYRKEWQGYEKKLKEYEEVEKDETREKKLKQPEKPKKDEGKEILLQAMDKKIPVRVEAHRPDAVLNALRLKKEFGLKLILEKCEGWPAVLSLLKEASVPILTNPLLDYKKLMMPGGAKGYAASLLKAPEDDFFYSDRVKISMENGSGKNWKQLLLSTIPLVLIPPNSFPYSARYMRFYASILVSEGLSVEEALMAITSTPAKVLGVSQRVGNLEKGKDADLVVLDGDPLNSLSKIEMVFVNGSAVWERKK